MRVTGYAGGPAEDSKRALRARFRAERRERAALREREADAAALAEAGMAVVAETGVAPGEWVSIYESTPVEPPTHALVDALRARGIRVMVPITLPDLDLDWATVRLNSVADYLVTETIEPDPNKSVLMREAETRMKSVLSLG